MNIYLPIGTISSKFYPVLGYYVKFILILGIYMQKIFFLFLFLFFSSIFFSPKIKANNFFIFDNSFQYDYHDPDNLKKEIFSSDYSFQNSENYLENFILNTKSTIDFYIYELRNETVQKAILTLLKKDIRVRILGEPDPVGNGCDCFSKFDKESNYDCQKSARFINIFKTLAKKQKNKDISGSRIKFFNKNTCRYPDKTKNRSCFQHGKSIVRDGTFTLISTGNFNDSSLCLGTYRNKNICNRDLSVIIKNKNISKSISTIFNTDFKYGNPCDLPPSTPRPNNVIRLATEAKCKTKDIAINPHDQNTKIEKTLDRALLDNVLTVNPVSAETITDLLQSAQKSIKFQTQYLKEEEWQKAILSALDRNVDVKITLSSLCFFNQTDGVGTIKSRTLFGDYGYLSKWLDPILNQSSNHLSIKIFKRPIPLDHQKTLAYQHAKFFVIDDELAWLGSTNGSHTSTKSNREFGIIIRDKRAIKYLSKIFLDDHKSSMTLADHLPSLSNDGKIDYYPIGSCKII